MNTNIFDISSNKTWDGKTVSKREIECAYCLVDGLSAKESAKKMNISHRTVEKYIENLKTKLKCRNQKELISIVIRNLQYLDTGLLT